MSRFILRYRGPGPKPGHDVERFRDLGGATVLDEQSPRMLLVEAPEEDLRKLLEQTPDWVMSSEKSYRLPPPHPSLEKARSLKKPK